ncbi:MAG TPA: adenylate/guanylate cyclase domain-containing protein [Polyangiaceae bacterium]|nr:adenylate/guanylate cyclase domain-containing protein [Polyangiaceae bacterium]
MFTRLPTIRAKFTALVSLSVVVMLAALPVLSWLLHRQLVDEVDNRVTDAERAFQTELDDDLADLLLASRVLATDGATAHAIKKHDATRAKQLAQVFVDVYPNMDVLIVEADGKVLGQVGCENPPDHIGGVAGLADLARGVALRGVVEHGCESSGSTAPPAYVIGVPIPTGGGVIVCLPLDAGYLQNASAKLGLQLALAVIGGDKKVVGQTPEFPHGALAVASRESTIVDAADRSWAVARFEPRQLEGAMGKVGMLAALDVTDVRVIVRRNLVYALGVLAIAAAVSVAFGSRLAAVMSGALARVNAAVKRVQELDYVHVDPVNTGDELEDLARGFNTMVDGLKERDKLRTTFGKYMTAQVMEHLLAGKVALGGESLRVTILFTDIRSFTTISEKMDPQQLVGLLNEYFSEMVGIVMQEDGVVDKYIGDAIMAVFGAPVPKAGDAANAVRAAVRMRRALQTLNEGLSLRGLPTLRTGIGIHTGEVVAGNIGSEKRMEYTVIGDAVNLASRLETSTKDLGVNVLISEDTYELTKDVVETRPVREITVKGRKQPVLTYEVLGLKGEPPLEASDSAPIASARPAPS